MSDVEVIYDHPQFVVINKCQAQSFHCEAQTLGLFEQVKSQLAMTQLYPVHRLDRLTTGLVIFAKTKSSASAFGQLFELHQINKFYLALSAQKPKKKQGWIKGDMAKARRGAWKLLRSHDNPAVSQFVSCALSNQQRLFLVKPHSGKTHQIRVALKSLGSAILGDSLYGGSDADRGYLHAYGLTFSLFEQNFSFVAKPNSGQWFCHDEVTEQLSKLWSQPWSVF